MNKLLFLALFGFVVSANTWCSKDDRDKRNTEIAKSIADEIRKLGFDCGFNVTVRSSENSNTHINTVDIDIDIDQHNLLSNLAGVRMNNNNMNDAEKEDFSDMPDLNFPDDK